MFVSAALVVRAVAAALAFPRGRLGAIDRASFAPLKPEHGEAGGGSKRNRGAQSLHHGI